MNDHNFVNRDKKIAENEKKTLLVVLLTLVTMVVEIVYGHITGSMALLADGWHMGSHVGALGISLIAYRLARSEKHNKKFTFGTGKFIPLGGYTSAILLAVVALVMIGESVARFLGPIEINFDTALIVSVIGLIVNLLSAFLLWDFHADHHHHGHDHTHDHNHKSALVHVLTDALTSFFAIFALLLGKYQGLVWADPIMGIVGAVVILKWAYGLCRETGWELLDGQAKAISEAELKLFLENHHEFKVLDLHVWRIAPNAHAGEIIIESKNLRGSDYYRQIINEKFNIEHLIIEERLLQ